MTTGAIVFLVAFGALAIARLKGVSEHGSGQGACSFFMLLIVALIACAAIAVGLSMRE